MDDEGNRVLVPELNEQGSSVPLSGFEGIKGGQLFCSSTYGRCFIHAVSSWLWYIFMCLLQLYCLLNLLVQNLHGILSLAILQVLGRSALYCGWRTIHCGLLTLHHYEVFVKDVMCPVRLLFCKSVCLRFRCDQIDMAIVICILHRFSKHAKSRNIIF